MTLEWHWHIPDCNAEYGNVPESYKIRPSTSLVLRSRVMYVVALLLASTFALCGLAIPLVQELSSWIPSTSERVLMSPSLSTHSPRFQERSYFPSQCASGSAWSPPSYVEWCFISRYPPMGKHLQVPAQVSPWKSYLWINTYLQL